MSEQDEGGWTISSSIQKSDQILLQLLHKQQMKTNESKRQNGVLRERLIIDQKTESDTLTTHAIRNRKIGRDNMYVQFPSIKTQSNSFFLERILPSSTTTAKNKDSQQTFVGSGFLASCNSGQKLSSHLKTPQTTRASLHSLEISNALESVRSPPVVSSLRELNSKPKYHEDRIFKPTSPNGMALTQRRVSTYLSSAFPIRYDIDFVRLHCEGFKQKRNIDLFKHFLRMYMINKFKFQEIKKAKKEAAASQSGAGTGGLNSNYYKYQLDLRGTTSAQKTEGSVGFGNGKLLELDQFDIDEIDRLAINMKRSDQFVAKLAGAPTTYVTSMKRSDEYIQQRRKLNLQEFIVEKSFNDLKFLQKVVQVVEEKSEEKDTENKETEEGEKPLKGKRVHLSKSPVLNAPRVFENEDLKGRNSDEMEDDIADSLALEEAFISSIISRIAKYGTKIITQADFKDFKRIVQDREKKIEEMKEEIRLNKLTVIKQRVDEELNRERETMNQLEKQAFEKLEQDKFFKCSPLKQPGRSAQWSALLRETEDPDREGEFESKNLALARYELVAKVKPLSQKDIVSPMKKEDSHIMQTITGFLVPPKQSSEYYNNGTVVTTSARTQPSPLSSRSQSQWSQSQRGTETNFNAFGNAAAAAIESASGAIYHHPQPISVYHRQSQMVTSSTIRSPFSKMYSSNYPANHNSHANQQQQQANTPVQVQSKQMVSAEEFQIKPLRRTSLPQISSKIFGKPPSLTQFDQFQSPHSTTNQLSETNIASSSALRSQRFIHQLADVLSEFRSPRTSITSAGINQPGQQEQLQSQHHAVDPTFTTSQHLEMLEALSEKYNMQGELREILESSAAYNNNFGQNNIGAANTEENSAINLQDLSIGQNTNPNNNQSSANLSSSMLGISKDDRISRFIKKFSEHVQADESESFQNINYNANQSTRIESQTLLNQNANTSRSHYNQASDQNPNQILNQSILKQPFFQTPSQLTERNTLLQKQQTPRRKFKQDDSTEQSKLLQSTQQKESVKAMTKEEKQQQLLEKQIKKLSKNNNNTLLQSKSAANLQGSSSTTRQSTEPISKQQQQQTQKMEIKSSDLFNSITINKAKKVKHSSIHSRPEGSIAANLLSPNASAADSSELQQQQIRRELMIQFYGLDHRAEILKRTYTIEEEKRVRVLLQKRAEKQGIASRSHDGVGAKRMQLKTKVTENEVDEEMLQFQHILDAQKRVNDSLIKKIVSRSSMAQALEEQDQEDTSTTRTLKKSKFVQERSQSKTKTIDTWNPFTPAAAKNNGKHKKVQLPSFFENSRLLREIKDEETPPKQEQPPPTQPPKKTNVIIKKTVNRSATKIPSNNVIEPEPKSSKQVVTNNQIEEEIENEQIPTEEAIEEVVALPSIAALVEEEEDEEEIPIKPVEILPKKESTQLPSAPRIVPRPIQPSIVIPSKPAVPQKSVVTTPVSVVATKSATRTPIPSVKQIESGSVTPQRILSNHELEEEQNIQDEDENNLLMIPDEEIEQDVQEVVAVVVEPTIEQEVIQVPKNQVKKGTKKKKVVIVEEKVESTPVKPVKRLTFEEEMELLQARNMTLQELKDEIKDSIELFQGNQDPMVARSIDQYNARVATVEKFLERLAAMDNWNEDDDDEETIEDFLKSFLNQKNRWVRDHYKGEVMKFSRKIHVAEYKGDNDLNGKSSIIDIDQYMKHETLNRDVAAMVKRILGFRGDAKFLKQVKDMVIRMKSQMKQIGLDQAKYVVNPRGANLARMSSVNMRELESRERQEYLTTTQNNEDFVEETPSIEDELNEPSEVDSVDANEVKKNQAVMERLRKLKKENRDRFNEIVAESNSIKKNINLLASLKFQASQKKEITLLLRKKKGGKL